MTHGTQHDLWAFREGKKDVNAEKMFRALAGAVDRLLTHSDDVNIAMSALLRAGEFESGLADGNSPAQYSAARLTDLLAKAFVGEKAAASEIRQRMDELDGGELPRMLAISPAEGFAYYALHPGDFANLAERLATENQLAVVIGIRSIGTTLSAIVRADLGKRGKRTERLTVRPTGHPYDRVTHFRRDELDSIAQWNARSADFLVVDEGPGRSGSSFLSVAEALVNAGVPPARIALLGSRQPDLNALCAHNAAARWSRFQFCWPDASAYGRFWDHIYIGGGDWRNVLLSEPTEWLACWPQMERLKFLSPDRQHIYKFEGYGRFGEEVLARAEAMFKAGFGPAAQDAGDGMIRYPVIPGRVLRSNNLSRELLEHIAHYCAFRVGEFGVAGAPPTLLPSMVGFNVMQEFGIELDTDLNELRACAPVLADGRMQPYEWIRTTDSSWVKVDGFTHGDDHFFPGPTDIAWDLVGAIVEWNMEESAAEFLTQSFMHQTGLDVSGKISEFKLAYTVFRLAYCKMALSTVYGSDEWNRMQRAYQHYRALASQQISVMQPVKAISFSMPAQKQTA